MNIIIRTCCVVLTLLINQLAVAQPRSIISINDGWKFNHLGAAYAETVLFNDDNWEIINLPHTWNAFDPFDDDQTYARDIGWYRKVIQLDTALVHQKHFLYFEGAAQSINVYMNGYYAGQHKGGYTGFSIDVSPYLNWKTGRNILAVQVSNAHDPMIAPLNVGYASYGGLYRDAWLISTSAIHFSTIDNNSSGVYLTTPGLPQQHMVHVKSVIANDGKSSAAISMLNIVYDKQHREMTRFDKTMTVAAGESLSIEMNSPQVDEITLWNPDSPELYTVVTQLVHNNKVVDEVENKIGFRYYQFNNDGFTLNGKKLILNGTNRHQDLQGKGDALSFEDHLRDMQLIKDMGCNFVRLAHYPQAKAVLQLADALGLLVWEEVPVVNFVTRDPQFLSNTENMIREMISQGYNHPSVILWGSSNEILLHGPDGERIGKQNDTAYLRAVRNISKQLDSTVRASDPSRISTVAMHASNDYSAYGLDTIATVSGYNIYSGWYSGDVKDFGHDLDIRRKKDHPLFVSEYGAEGEISLNSESPTRLDYTGQYQRFYHESYIRQIRARSWLAGTALWNEFDFSQPNIGGPQPNRNQKGLITWDRQPKDAYYLYKANWSKVPMVYIASRNWMRRTGIAGSMSTIDVYSNGAAIQLVLNGKKFPSQNVNDVHKATWQVPLIDGDNEVVATSSINGKEIVDRMIIHYDAILFDEQFKTLSINVGAAVQYIDPSGNAWAADKLYSKGSYGYQGGRWVNFDRKDITANTDDEPMYYSLADSIGSYKIDVPEGSYKVTLCFSEYKRLEKGARVFDVLINDAKVIDHLDLTEQAGFAQAIEKSFVIGVNRNDGLTIRFNSTKGGALLNGIRIQRL